MKATEKQMAKLYHVVWEIDIYARSPLSVRSSIRFCPACASDAFIVLHLLQVNLVLPPDKTIPEPKGPSLASDRAFRNAFS